MPKKREDQEEKESTIGELTKPTLWSTFFEAPERLAKTAVEDVPYLSDILKWISSPEVQEGLGAAQMALPMGVPAGIVTKVMDPRWTKKSILDKLLLRGTPEEQIQKIARTVEEKYPAVESATKDMKVLLAGPSKERQGLYVGSSGEKPGWAAVFRGPLGGTKWGIDAVLEEMGHKLYEASEQIRKLAPKATELPKKVYDKLASFYSGPVIGEEAFVKDLAKQLKSGKVKPSFELVLSKPIEKEISEAAKPYVREFTTKEIQDSAKEAINRVIGSGKGSKIGGGKIAADWGKKTPQELEKELLPRPTGYNPETGGRIWEF